MKEDEFIREKVDYKFLGKVHPVAQGVPKTRSTNALLNFTKQSEVSSALHKIKQPVLLIWGLQDDITPPETALHFHDLLPNSELKFIDQCGHVPMMDQPQLFNQHLKEFLILNE